MRNLIITCFLFLFSIIIYGQNIGIATTTPETKLQVTGDFSVIAPYTATNAMPTPSQTQTMANKMTNYFASTDSTGRIYDPGGPAGNYQSNFSAATSIQAGDPTSYLEIIVESVDLNTLDSLIIFAGSNSSAPVFLMVGNGYTTVASITYTIPSPNCYIYFKSNPDVSVGAGFSILFRRRYTVTNLPEVKNIGGNAFIFSGSKGALRSGLLSTATIGNYSTAMGYNTAAVGIYSTALGNGTRASGSLSTAMGYLTEASGIGSTALGNSTKATNESTAMGTLTLASGRHSTAMGNETQATGENSIAFGEGTLASGVNSTAMGSGTDATGAHSIAMGEFSTARGARSTAMGEGTISMGVNSTAMGFLTNAKSYASLAIGKFNDTLLTESETTWLSADRAFVIGDGNESGTRSNCFYILKNGNTWMQGTLTQNSDARLKTNIHRVDNALGKIKSLNGYNYTWKDSTVLPGLYTGVLAQEVLKVMPELVTLNSEGQLAVNYMGMVPYLVESIKTLEKQNALLQKRLIVLETKIKGQPVKK